MTSQGFVCRELTKRLCEGCPEVRHENTETGVQGQPKPHGESYLIEMSKVKKNK